jgi:hypothetical protein
MNGIDEEVKKAYDIINLKQELRITAPCAVKEEHA